MPALAGRPREHCQQTGGTRRPFSNVHRLRVEMKLGYWRTSLWYCTHIAVRQRTIIPNARMKNSAPVCCGEMI